jgi:hypothetical protein
MVVPACSLAGGRPKVTQDAALVSNGDLNVGFRVNACALVDGIAFEKYASHGLKVPGVVTLLLAE